MNRRARVLIAGVGNVFRSDDGFGSAVVHRLTTSETALPPDVEAIDVGIRGVHLAYQLLEGYRTLVLVDTTRRGGPPGTLYLLEHDLDQAAEADPSALNAHGMDPTSVLALLGQLAGELGVEHPIERALVLGCEPASLADGLELSEPVLAAVERAVPALHDLVRSLTRDEELTDADPVADRGVAGRRHGADHQLHP